MATKKPAKPINRQRRLLCQLAATAGLCSSQQLSANIADKAITRKMIPGTDESIPCIGMGSWITFDVPDVGQVRNQRAEVLKKFFEMGGGMIDSSPMYGHAESVIGYCLSNLDNTQKLFSASKIWTPSAGDGKSQMSNTESLWGVKPMDLMYVHNLLSWRKHLPNLRKWKEEGRVRYIGVTTSHGRRHEEMEQFLKTEPVDFIQLTYNIEQTGAEDRLLPMARDLGIGVIVNRPFERGALMTRYGSQPLPTIATEIGCENWAQFLLLYIVSHPAVTCAIPATSRVDHMAENMSTMGLALPDMAIRLEMKKAIG